MIRSGQKERTLFLALACVLIPAVALFSFLPSHDKRILHTHGRFHSWGHLAVFAVVAYVAGRAVRSPWARVLLFAGIVVLGMGIEVGEHFVFTSPLEWKDMVADAAGVTLGMLLALMSEPGESESAAPQS